MLGPGAGERNGEMKAHVNTKKCLLKEEKFLLLFVFLLSVLLIDVVVLQAVGALVRGNNAYPIAKLVLMQKLLRQKLQVALRESELGFDGYVVVRADDADNAMYISWFAIDLDAIIQEFLLKTAE